MALYRIYIDEVGNHDLVHADDPNIRFLSLTGVIVESSYMLYTLQPEMEKIKVDFFQTDPDTPIIFHRKELVNKNWPFHSLRDPDIEEQFNKVLLNSLTQWQYRVVTVVIDKKVHRDRYITWRHHPYHYCLQVLLERYVLYLYYGKNRGDVMIEGRGGKEDRKLKDSYNRLYELGTDHIHFERWQSHITSNQLKVKPKRANITGLQLADIIAHASRREILLENGLISDTRRIFSDEITHILSEGKYLRSSTTGRIEGIGKKLLP